MPLQKMNTPHPTPQKMGKFSIKSPPLWLLNNRRVDIFSDGMQNMARVSRGSLRRLVSAQDVPIKTKVRRQKHTGGFANNIFQL